MHKSFQMSTVQKSINEMQTSQLVRNPFFIPPVSNNYAPPMIQIPYIPRTNPHTSMGYRPNVIHNTGQNTFLSPMSVSSTDSFEYRMADNMVKKVNVAKLHVEVSISSKATVFRLMRPSTNKAVKFIIDSNDPYNKGMVTTIVLPHPITFFKLDTIPGKLVTVHIQCRSSDDKYLIAEWSRTFRAELSHEEYRKLLNNCLAFLQTKPFYSANQEFKVIYRCKPKAYWDQIHYNSNGIMQKYLKDENGQPGNRINGRIKGLFFSANASPSGQLPFSSYFGNVRMVCDAYNFLNPTIHNFYFADFYCNKVKHYVTIVICVANSETDLYCRDNLLKVDPFTNPFIRVAPGNRDSDEPWKFYLNKTLLVEIFYTEDVSLSVGHFAGIESAGAGTSRTNGVPNNKYCGICNLYPKI